MPNDQPDWTSVVARPQTQLAGSPYTVASGTDTRTFTLAPDTSIILILIPSFFNVTDLQVHGVTSGFTYIKAQPDLTSYHPYYTGVISSAVDSQISITISVGSSTTVYVSSVPDAVATLTMPNQPAPWEAPNQPAQKVDFGNPGQNNVTTLIAAPINAQSIWLHTLAYKWNAAPANAFGVWQTSDGKEIGADAVPSAGGWQFTDFKGVKLGAGFSFGFKQTSTAAAGSFFAQGFCTYSIY